MTTKKEHKRPEIRLYTPKQVGEILHLGVDRVRVLVKERKLKAYIHFGRLRTARIYILDHDLRDYIEREFLSLYMDGRKKTYRRPKNIWK
jgi:hypothetical protein